MWTLLAHTRLWGDDPFLGPEPSLIFVPEEELKLAVDLVAIKLPLVNCEKYLRFIEKDPEYCYIEAQDLADFPLSMKFSDLISRLDVVMLSKSLNNGIVNCVTCNFSNNYADPTDDPKSYLCYKCRSGL